MLDAGPPVPRQRDGGAQRLRRRRRPLVAAAALGRGRGRRGPRGAVLRYRPVGGAHVGGDPPGGAAPGAADGARAGAFPQRFGRPAGVLRARSQRGGPAHRDLHPAAHRGERRSCDGGARRAARVRSSATRTTSCCTTASATPVGPGAPSSARRASRSTASRCRCPQRTDPSQQRRQMSTFRLLGTGLAEDQRRAALASRAPASLLVLTLLAVPLGRTPPRSGRYGRLGFAILCS
jgi:hypothetical protein